MGADKQMESGPRELMSTCEDSSSEYMHVIVKAPRLTGFPLRCFTWLLETSLIGTFLKPKLKKDNLITKVFEGTRYQEPPMYIPQYPIEIAEEQGSMVRQVEEDTSPAAHVAEALQCLPPFARKETNNGNDDKHGFRHWTIRDYAQAYSSGTLTPTMVAERFYSAVEESNKLVPSMSLFISMDLQDILAQAAASTARYSKGTPLSPLDGVPIAVKDEIDCLPHPTTGGTKWLHKVRVVKEDAMCIKRLRECGAVLVGKTNMHELGMGTTGINPHYGATRNPYNKEKGSGGSSGGSAAAVAAGLCPAALGVDGGGSVRMPAGLCGVVGFKQTFGRTTSAGLLPLNWTVGMLGTLTATVEDALIMYAAIHGHLPGDCIVSLPPPANLPLLNDLEGISFSNAIGDIKLAKYTEWFDDSDDGVRSACYRALELLQQAYGCKVLEVTVPELEEMRLAHFITIGSECSTSLGIDYQQSGLHSSGADVRVGFALYDSFSHRELISAQRMRFRQMHYHMDIFKKANVIVTPTTGATAPSVVSDALKCGELNYGIGAKLMRFQIAGNFLGLPAISVPIGHDESGLPIGLQLIGRPWSEATLLQLAAVIERLCAPYRKQPEVLYDLLL